MEGAKVTVPLEAGLSYSNSKETSEEKKMAEKDFTSSTSQYAEE